MEIHEQYNNAHKALREIAPRVADDGNDFILLYKANDGQIQEITYLPDAPTVLDVTMLDVLLRRSSVRNHLSVGHTYDEDGEKVDE